jgi:hypothetical protein
MEVNGRYWGTISLPVFAGIDFPFYQWQLAHSEVPAVPDHYAVGTTWRWTSGHVARINGLLMSTRRSTAARKELLHSLLQLPAAFRPSIRDALFSVFDPMPATLELLRAIKFYCLDDAKELLKRLPLRH